jgi:hypothetical protein
MWREPVAQRSGTGRRLAGVDPRRPDLDHNLARARDARRDQPLIDPAFFRSLPFAGAVVAAFVALSGFLFLNTLYLRDVRGLSALGAGLLTTPMAAAAALASPMSGRLTAARACRWQRPGC